MHLYYDNINDAFTGIVQGFHTGIFDDGAQLAHHGFRPPISRTESRNGEVLVIEEPVTITYAHPLRRVLFNPARDCNPFFHVIEALWMLAGRNDLEPLVHFNSEMAKFSDDGSTLWGAYGHRWRGFFGHPDYSETPDIHNMGSRDLDNPPRFLGMYHDQLADAIEILNRDRTTRRVVIEHWSNEDLYRVANILSNCKDVPCNLCVIFQPRLVHDGLPTGNPVPVNVLDMTVINRSNDMLLGALGANYVHFSFLHEYMALAAGFQVGRYNQISNNLHLYISPKEDGSRWLPTKCQPEELLKSAGTHRGYTPLDSYDGEWHLKLYNDREVFDREVKFLFDSRFWRAESIQDFGETAADWESPFLTKVAFPMILAFNAHKRRDYLTATAHCKNIKQGDWYVNCVNWLARREANYNRAKDGGVHAVPQ